MSNATQILLWTKSNLEIVDLNFVTPKRFGSLRYVNMWLSIDMNSDVEMISSFPGDTRGNMTVRWVIMKVLRTPGESQEDPGMLPRDYTQLWSSRGQLSLTCLVMTGGSHQSRKDKK